MANRKVQIRILRYGKYLKGQQIFLDPEFYWPLDEPISQERNPQAFPLKFHFHPHQS